MSKTISEKKYKVLETSLIESYRVVNDILWQADLVGKLDSAVEMVQIRDLKPVKYAISKQVPIAPLVSVSVKGNLTYACSECETAIKDSDIYCRTCGQRIKWKE